MPGARLVALEHDEAYFKKGIRAVEEHGLSATVEVRHAPLEETGLEQHTTPWYSMSAVEDLADIGLLLVDGPPTMTGPAARYPALPVLAHKLATDGLVFLDDYERKDERETMAAWLDASEGWEEQETGVFSLGMLRRRQDSGRSEI